MRDKKRRFFLQFWCILLPTILIISCSSNPDITGLWQADFDDQQYFRFLPDLAFKVYADWDSEKASDLLISGEYRFYELKGLECFGFGYYPDGSQATGMVGTLQVIEDNQLVLNLDEGCNLGWSSWDTDQQISKVTFNRVD